MSIWKMLFRTNESRQLGANEAESFVNSLGMKFVAVPGVKARVCIWETRVIDFEAFVNATGYDATEGGRTLASEGWGARGGSWKSPGFAQTPEQPVCCVNWEDAKAFCKWLTEREHAEGRLSKGQKYRLPTDAEWSVAVGLPPERCGTPKYKDENIRDMYPWGTQWPPPVGAGNYAGEEVEMAPDTPSSWEGLKGYREGYARTSPVGSFSPNRFGLYDMGGNLWEFCEDAYDAHSASRTLRGASWCISLQTSMLSSCRYEGVPGVRSSGNGFRCVLAHGGASA